MKRKLIVSLVIITVAFSCCIFNPITVYAKPEKVIKVQTIYGISGRGAHILRFFVEKVDLLTNGAVKVKLYWPGQLVAAKEGLTALQKGMIDGIFIASGLYFGGAIPEMAGSWLPYAWAGANEMEDIYFNYGYLDIMREACEKNGLYFVTFTTGGGNLYNLNFPVRKLEDLKGKKIRGGGVAADVVQAMGASPVNLTPAEIYTGLQRGTMDGMIYPWYGLEDYKYHEVITHLVTPAIFDPGMLDLIFNKKVWESLDPKYQKAINLAGIQAYFYSKQLDDISNERIRVFCREKNVKIIELSETESARFKKAVEPIYQEHAKKSPLCAKQIEILKKYSTTKHTY